MQTWIIYAIISMIFAGLTSVLAKYGVQYQCRFWAWYQDYRNFCNHYNYQFDRSQTQRIC